MEVDGVCVWEGVVVEVCVAWLSNTWAKGMHKKLRCMFGCVLVR